MKKDLFKRITAGFCLGGALAMAGCGKVTIKGADLGGIGEMQVYDAFSLEGLKLKLRMSDGSVREIDITTSMVVEMPDMTTPGEKILKVKYENVIYELKFNVATQSKEDMLGKLRAFYNDYSTSLTKGDINMSLVADFDAKFLDEKGEYNQEFFNLILKESDTTFDELINNLYKGALDAVIKSSLNITTEQITDSNKMMAVLNLAQVMSNLGENLGNIDYGKYLADQLLPESQDANNIEGLANSVMNLLFIDVENSNAKTACKNFANKQINALRDLLKSKSEDKSDDYYTFLKSVVNDLSTLANNYSQDGLVKYYISTINSILKGEEITPIKYVENFINKALFGDPQVDYASDITGAITDMFLIEGEEPVAEVKQFVEEYLGYLRNISTLENEPGEEGSVYVNKIKAMINDLNTLVQDYSADATGKAAMNTLNESIKAQSTNLVSELLNTLSEQNLQLIHNDTILPGDEEAAQEWGNDYILALSKIVKAVEDFVNTETAFDSMSDARDAIATLLGDIKEVVQGDIKALEDIRYSYNWYSSLYDHYIFESVDQIFKYKMDTAIVSVLTTLAEEDYTHLISNLFTDVKTDGFCVVHRQVVDEDSWYWDIFAVDILPTDDDYDEAMAWSNSYLENASKIIRAVEDMLTSDTTYTSFEDARDNLETMFTDLKDANDAMMALREQLDEKFDADTREGWRCYVYERGESVFSSIDMLSSVYTEYIQSVLAKIDEGVAETVVEIISKIPTGLFEQYGVTEELELVIREIVVDLIRGNSLETFTKADYERYIDKVCALLNSEQLGLGTTFDAETYKAQITVEGDVITSGCTILADLVDARISHMNSEDVNENGSTNDEKAVYNACLNLMQYLDNIPVRQGIEPDKFLHYLSTLFDKQKVYTQGFIDNAQEDEYGSPYYSEYATYDVLSILLNPGDIDAPNYVFDLAKMTDDNMKTLLSNVEYREGIEYLVASTIAQMVGIEMYDDNYLPTIGMTTLELKINLHTSKYLDGEFEMDKFLADMLYVVNNFGEESTKTFANAIAMIGTIMNSQGDDIDYNELFGQLGLPEELESIDYNVLIGKLQNGEYKLEDMISLNGVDVQYVVNSQGKLDKEIMTIKLSVDFDMSITSIKGDLTYTFTIDV